MADNGNQAGELTPKQQRALRALLTCKNVAEAAAAASVGERTLHRWRSEPEFRAALSLAEGELLDAATRRLLALHERAIDALEALIDGAQTDSVRLQAARVAIEASLKLRELRDIDQRIAALEAAMAAQKEQGRWA